MAVLRLIEFEVHQEVLQEVHPIHGENAKFQLRQNTHIKITPEFAKSYNRRMKQANFHGCKLVRAALISIGLNPIDPPWFVLPPIGRNYS